MEATTTITAAEGETFTHSAYVYNSDTGHYDIEVGPRQTFRRTAAENLQPGDLLMDAYGSPSLVVQRVTLSARQASVLLGSSLGGAATAIDRFERAEVLSVHVSTVEVRPSFVPGVTPESAL